MQWAVIAPSRRLDPTTAAAIEAGATFLQLACVFVALSNPRWRRYAAGIAGVLLAGFIAALPQTSGAGFNPIRGLAPDVLAGVYPAGWIYVAGPLVGAAVAGLGVRYLVAPPVTAKLHHDPDIPCFLRCELAHSVAAAQKMSPHPGRQGGHTGGRPPALTAEQVAAARDAV